MTEATTEHAIAPPARIAVIGLGQMGVPMAARLIAAGFEVRGADPSAPARAALTQAGGAAFESAAEAVREAAAVIAMLPNGRIVHDAFLGPAGVAPFMRKDAVAIDMSSSAPTDTIALAAELAQLGLPLVDAPVSGGVKRAVDGSLSIMAGGPEAAVARVRPVLAAMGKSIFATGPTGSGHAMKALNNYVSAAGLVAACEALIVGRDFGLAPETIVDVLNASTGRNNSTEVKLKPFVISERYNSGFALALMAKDLRIAADLAAHRGLDLPQIGRVAALWEDARAHLEPQADHTEIHRFLAGKGRKPEPRS